MRTVSCPAVLLLTAWGIRALAAPVADLNPVTIHVPPKHAPVVLVRDGEAKAEIVNMSEGRMAQAAVRDLQRFIQAATGAELKIVKEPSGAAAIVVGDSPAAREAGLVPEDMPVEGFAIKTAPGAVFLVGRDGAGTAWAVDEFLERMVGVRWYWPEERGSEELIGTSVQSLKELIVQPVSLTDAPFFRKRHRWPSGGANIGKALMADHDRRLRSHSSWPISIIVHAPHNWAKLYAETRPQIFQLRSDGERDFSMLCYGHPLTLQTYLEEIDIQMQMLAAGERIEPQRRITDGTSVTVSPADIAVACRCEDCRRLWDEDGGSYATASPILGEFVARLGRELKKRDSALTVVFLPYKNYTYAPDGIEFPDNVEVQICGMPGLAQYKDPVINASEQANIDKWVALTGRRIQNWHYSCWPANRTKAAYLFPHTIQSHYRANADKTVGSFINGIGNHWPRQHVSLYVWLKVLWNPEFNVEAAIDEYCRRMYGPAAATMRELVGMLVAGWERNEWESHTFSPRAVYEESYPREDVLRMEALLERAETEAKDDALVLKRLAYYGGPLRDFFAESKQYVEGTGIRRLNAYQVPEAPAIDGSLDDAGWEGVEPLPFVRATDKEQPEPKYPTTLMAVWSRQGITFGFRMHEPTPDALKRDIGASERDASLMWWNDNVEIFLDVAGQRSGYYQFIVNPNGALYDAKDGDTSWTSEGVKAAAQVGEDYWSLEVFIPYATFEDAVAPATGVEWYGNFTRHRVTDRKSREYQRLNTTFAGPSNDQNAFGPITFVER